MVEREFKNVLRKPKKELETQAQMLHRLKQMKPVKGSQHWEGYDYE